jgi:hypothetical protein
MTAPTRQIHDLIFDILSGFYNTGRTDVQFGDLFTRWLADQGLFYGDSLADFYTAQTGVKNFGDAQWEYWANTVGDNYLLEDGSILRLENNGEILTEDAYTFS